MLFVICRLACPYSKHLNLNIVQSWTYQIQSKGRQGKVISARSVLGGTADFPLHATCILVILYAGLFPKNWHSKQRKQYFRKSLKLVFIFHFSYGPLGHWNVNLTKTNLLATQILTFCFTTQSFLNSFTQLVCLWSGHTHAAYTWGFVGL